MHLVFISEGGNLRFFYVHNNTNLFFYIQIGGFIACFIFELIWIAFHFTFFSLIRTESHYSHPKKLKGNKQIVQFFPKKFV